MKDAHLPGLVTHVQKQLSKSNDLCSGPHSQEFFVNCPHPVPWGFEVVSKQLLALRKKKIIKSTETEAVGLNPQGASQVKFQTGLSPERGDRRKRQPLQISRINKQENLQMSLSFVAARGIDLHPSASLNHLFRLLHPWNSF